MLHRVGCLHRSSNHCYKKREYVHSYIHTYTRTYIHTYIHPYIHTYTHTHSYINIELIGDKKTEKLVFILKTHDTR